MRRRPAAAWRTFGERVHSTDEQSVRLWWRPRETEVWPIADGHGGTGWRGAFPVGPDSPLVHSRLVRAHSSAWLERIPDKDEVPGSNPGGPTNERPGHGGFGRRDYPSQAPFDRQQSTNSPHGRGSSLGRVSADDLAEGRGPPGSDAGRQRQVFPWLSYAGRPEVAINGHGRIAAPRARCVRSRPLFPSQYKPWYALNSSSVSPATRSST